MTRKLNEADRAAVDMLFDRINAASNGGNGNGDSVYAAAGAVSEERLAAVQKVLSLLDEVPAMEPPADLAVRTLQRVARDGGIPASMQTPAPAPYVDPTQPMA